MLAKQINNELEYLYSMLERYKKLNKDKEYQWGIDIIISQIEKLENIKKK